MSTEQKTKGSLMSYIIRLILVSFILLLTSFLTPGFSIRGIWSFLIAALVITGIDYLVEMFTGFDSSPFGRGFKGFIISAAILYITQFIVPNMNVSMIGALIASLIIGILDAIMPSRVM